MAIKAGNVMWNIGADLKPLSQALGDSEKAVKASMGNLAKYSQQLGVTFAAIGAGITAALGGAVNSAMDLGGEIKDAADKTAVGAEALQKLKYAAEQSGVGFESLQGAIIRMNKGLGDAAQTGKGPMVDALAQIGLSLDSLKGKTPDQQFTMMAEAISQIKDPAQQTAIAMDIFGKSGAQLLPMLNEGASGIEAMGIKAQELGLIMSGDAVNAAEAFGDAWETLKGQFQAVAVQIGSALIPVLEKVMPFFQDIVAGITNWIAANPELVSTIAMVVGGIGTAMLAMAPLLLALPGLAIAFGAVSTVAAVVGGALSGLAIPIAALAIGLGVVLVAAWGHLKAAFLAAKEWIASNWEQIKEIFWTGVEVGKTALSVFGELIRAGFNVIGAVFDGFGQGLGAAWTAVNTSNDEGTGTFLDTIQGMLETALPAIQALSDKVGEFANWIGSHWEDIASTTKWMVKEVAVPLFQFAATVIDVFETIIEWVGKLLSALAMLPEWAGGGGQAPQVPGAPPLPGNAFGGRVQAGMPSVVGEHGEELFVPDTDGRIYPASKTEGMMGGQVSATFNISNPNYSPDEIANICNKKLGHLMLSYGRT